MSKGYYVVLAHPERYLYLSRKECSLAVKVIVL